ncbi:hypothetical protein [Escherichia coli]|uniref:hypothetical protein n=1 Tax=Escherichia coli TaxID=562 RepID=UPI0019D4ABB0|nr:hypothetical protein [Escherichia coli]
MKPILFRPLLSLACLSAVPQVHAQADTTFTVESSAFADNGVMDRKYAGKNPANANCTGDNVSPPLHCRTCPRAPTALC